MEKGGKVTSGHRTFSIDPGTIALRRKNIEPVAVGAASAYAEVKIGMTLSPKGMKRATRAARALPAYRSVAIRPNYSDGRTPPKVLSRPHPSAQNAHEYCVFAQNRRITGFRSGWDCTTAAGLIKIARRHPDVRLDGHRPLPPSSSRNYPGPARPEWTTVQPRRPIRSPPHRRSRGWTAVDPSARSGNPIRLVADVVHRSTARRDRWASTRLARFRAGSPADRRRAVEVRHHPAQQRQAPRAPSGVHLHIGQFPGVRRSAGGGVAAQRIPVVRRLAADQWRTSP